MRDRPTRPTSSSRIVGALLMAACVACVSEGGFSGDATIGSFSVSGADTSVGTGGQGWFGCGNGVVDDDEECDLGPGNADDGACTIDCLLAVCGDGLVHTGAEMCDDAGESANCDVDCTAVECGDDTINVAAGESCEAADPDNAVCDDTCTMICDSGWDDCNADPIDGCEASLIDDPDSCSACGIVCETCRAGYCDAKYVFLTSTVYLGDLGGVAQADAACQATAEVASLPGTYLAWSSSPSEAVADRFTLDAGPYIRVDGEKVADDWTDLTDGTLDAPIAKTETGDDPQAMEGIACHGGPACVWAMTGTQADGTAYIGEGGHCEGWTSQMATFAGGDPLEVLDGWSLAAADLACDTAARLYCFEQ